MAPLRRGRSESIETKRMSDHSNFTITRHNDGSRQFGGNAHMDREGGRGRWQSRSYGGRRSRGGRGGRGNYRGRSSRGYGGNYQHDDRSGVNPRSRIDDNDEDDVSMDDNAGQKRNNYRYNPYRGRERRGSRYPRNTSARGDVHSRLGFKQQGSWSKISIPGGRDHDQNWLVSKLRNASKQTFQPVEAHYVGDSFVFFLEDPAVADALKTVSSRITCKDGSKIMITVRSCPPPRITKVESIEVDGKTKEVIMACLASRYDSATKVIDLSNVLESNVFHEQGITGKMSLQQLMLPIVDAINENCPDLQGLNLTNNNLHSLDLLKTLPEKTPELVTLNLRDNKVRHINELRKIQRLKNLESLDLRGNPTSTSYSKFESYVSEVRDFFPLLKTLDGTLLPAPITFDVPTAASIPKSVPSFVPDPKVGDAIMTFVTQYFNCYDNEDRQGLLEVYHDQAIFSVSVNTAISTNQERGVLQNFLGVSRNLHRVKDKEWRNRLIKKTRLSVVAFLNELRKTRHYFETFQVDVSVANATSLCFTIRGFFNDVESSQDLAFTRTFLAVPSTTAGGMKVINDQLHIRHLTVPQSKGFTRPAILAEVPPLSGPSEGLNEEQRAMVQKFSQQSRMTTDFSLECLKQNNWDYNSAAGVFTSLKEQGKIPPEAFRY